VQLAVVFTTCYYYLLQQSALLPTLLLYYSTITMVTTSNVIVLLGSQPLAYEPIHPISADMTRKNINGLQEIEHAYA